MTDLKYCPACGGQRLEDQGSVFIEDGPYTGNNYANEGDYARYRCLDCNQHFGDMPVPMTCSCGEQIYGDLGDDCDDDPAREGEYLCAECMKKGEG